MAGGVSPGKELRLGIRLFVAVLSVATGKGAGDDELPAVAGEIIAGAGIMTGFVM